MSPCVAEKYIIFIIERVGHIDQSFRFYCITLSFL
nr:MAG TPA: hypothetical protein [Caudoviricetes sp.]